MNPVQIIKNFIGKGLSPEGIIQNMNIQNPMMANLVKMANAGDTEGVEKIARNMFKEKGRDFDKEFSEFRSKFK